MIVDKINAYLSGSGQPIAEALLAEVGALAQRAFGRQFGAQAERAPTIRLSSIGHCLRQQAYTVLGVPPNGKEIDARARMIFFQGDLVELAIVQLAKHAGCPVTDCQQDLVLDGVSGHPDGLIEGKLLEVKSMSSYGFGRFERGDLDEGYRYQCNAYMAALGLTETVLVALNKDAGVLHEMRISLDPAIVEDIQGRIARLKRATLEALPPRPFAPNEKGFYPWNCLYCAHWKTCLPNAEKVLVKNAYKLKEKEKKHEAA